MDILFVSSEVAPWSKTGGLGDVCGSLPRALASRGHRVVTVSPRYGTTDASKAWDSRATFWVWLFGAHHEAHFVVDEESETLAHVLVTNPMFDRMGIYGDAGGFFGDNLLRFAFLSRVAMEIPRTVPLWGEPLGHLDVFHAHDWQAALVPAYLKATHQPVGIYPGTRAVLTVHNAAHQGRYASGEYGGLDLAPRHFDTLGWMGGISTLKGGIVSADAVTAVSPTFAQELCTPDGGFGMDAIYRAKHEAGQMHGIVNGIDTDSWNPATDKALPVNYDVERLEGKAACRTAMQKEMGLPVADVPMIILISRLDFQKGIDALLGAADQILGHDAQLVMLGSGDPALEDGLRAIEARHPTKARAWIGFDVALSRRLYAAADMCLVPSLFEPCGLTQLYSMRYGAVPIVRATGGLRDTVQQWEPLSKTGTGWTFEELSGAALARSVDYAIDTFYNHPDAFAALRRNGMTQDFSWDISAEKYEAIYAAP